MQDSSSRPNGPQAQNRDFLVHFDTYVTPDLTWIIGAYACFVRLGMADEAEALDGAEAFAWRLGASHFDAAALETLRDWIVKTLDSAIGPV